MQTTPSEHADDARAAQFLASTLTLLIVPRIIYGCRLYTRLRIVHRFFLEDYFITFAMVRMHPSTHTTDRTHQTRETQPNNVQASLTAFFATVPLQLSHGGGKHLTTLPQPSHSLALWGRAFFIAEIMYLLTLCLAKLSMTFLLLRFSSSSRLITWLLYSTAALITSLTLAFALWATFQCTPVQSQWDPSVQSGGCASKRSYMISVYVLSAFSAATDIIMAIVPVFILRRLEIDRRTKVAAGVTMGLGSL